MLLNRVSIFLSAVCVLILVSDDVTAQESIYSNKASYPISMEPFLTAGVALGDIDGDGDIDMIEANGRHWPQANYVYFNADNRRLSARYQLEPMERTSYRVRLADLDGDGDLDIIQASDKMRNQIHLNDGKGKFGPALFFGSVASNTRSIEVADINQDGAPDILEVSRGTQNLIFLNNGTGSFPTMAGDEREPLSFGAVEDRTLNVAVADMNGDGLMDLVMANRDGDANEILMRLGGMRFGRPVVFGSGSDDTRGVAVADMNGDGLPDIVTANIGEANAIILNRGDGRFELAHTFGAEDGQSYAIVATDLDNDQDIDIVIGNSNGHSRVFLNDGQGDLSMNAEIGSGRDRTYAVAVGDLNGDGRPDIVFGNSGSANVAYYQNVK